MFNVKSQDDYNRLSWEDKLRYEAENPANKYGDKERYRTQQVLYTNPTDSAKNWWAQQEYVRQGGNVNDAISGNFDKSAYQWQAGAPIRQTMQGYGLSNDKIGFDGKNVTYDGQKFMTPDVVADGTSYASVDKTLDAYKKYNENNNIVPARSYINQSNPYVNVGWDATTGQVLVGTQRLTPDYITPDGVAMVRRSVVDAALENAAEVMGLYSSKDIYDKNADQYDRITQQRYEDVVDRKPFAYDADEDPYYQAFKKEWLKQSQAQYDDTIAKANTQSGGAPSLGALSAAWNMYQDSIGQLEAYKNQFRNEAYQRWEDDYNRDVKELELTEHISDRFLDRDIARQKAILGDQESAINLQSLKDALEMNQALAPYQLKKAIQEYELGQLKLTEQGLSNLASQAKLNGLTFKDGQRTGGSDLDDGSPKDNGGSTPQNTYASIVDRNKQAAKEAGEYLTNDEIFAIAKATVDNGVNFDADLETAIKYVMGVGIEDEGTLAKILNAIKYNYGVPDEKFYAIVSKYE